MDIEYEMKGWHPDEYRTEVNNIGYWVDHNINNRGHLESKVEKIVNLLPLLIESYLISNPDKISEVAEIIECEGENHKLKRSKI